LTTTLADNLRFLRALITRPKNIGAIFPSSPGLAQAIARQVDPLAGPVLEIGPGTGVVTEAILARGVAPDHLTLLEYDEELARHIAARFPKTHVIHGDAFELNHTLGRATARHSGQSSPASRCSTIPWRSAGPMWRG
jgi:phosphatidylethanolamine/phosphatidyl-N-methylethanolamine N-methyltransferase